MCKSAAHVVVFAASGLHEFLELRHDLLPAAVARIIDAETVMDFFSSVEGKHDIAALAVGKIDDVIVDENAVGRKGEAEVLVMFFFHRARICDDVFDHLEIHERFAAEKVHFEVMSVPAVFDQEIDRALSDLKAHHRALAVVFALGREAVGTVEIAGVRDMQAQRLDDARSPRLQFPGHRLVGVLGKELARRDQGLDLPVALFDLFAVSHLRAFVFLFHVGKDPFHQRFFVDHAAAGRTVTLVQICLMLLDGSDPFDQIVGQVIDDVKGAGTDVQDNVISAQFELMNHVKTSHIRVLNES